MTTDKTYGIPGHQPKPFVGTAAFSVAFMPIDGLHLASGDHT